MSSRRFQDREISKEHNVKRSGLRRRMGPIMVFCILLIMVITSSLVHCRIYALALDAELDRLSYEKNNLERSLSDLKKSTLALGAPSAVYGYAFDNLGMTQGSVAGTIKVRYSDGEVASVIPEGKVGEWSGSLPPLKGGLDIKLNVDGAR
ncbi:FtsB/FtsL family cell division protein [Dethiosulfovibrio salsuginis]|uniref:Cell division protein FtsL n=1 Tax=Dethiosulfovibrio salsuginis TaxID=561720 RepID=A0A1X7I6S9_9BACT|nr:hypothetical protein [Dethiosulfovibrio salsuginis]SMG10015.1 hypothetical protein SAMN06275492_101169 [Dethiosulfovibrio salsuginis]